MYLYEAHKNAAPKFSFALKDLADFLGIFEVTEDELR
jgi:hypothetical protein